MGKVRIAALSREGQMADGRSEGCQRAFGYITSEDVEELAGIVGVRSR